MKGGSFLKTIIRVIAIIMIFTVIGFLMNISEDKEEDQINQGRSTSESYQTFEETADKGSEYIQTEGLINLIGKTSDELEEELGKPARVDRSAYGFHWWIYNGNDSHYVQVGVEGNQVATIYAIGKDVNIKPLYIGQPINEIYANYFIESIVSLDYKNSSYYFELSEEDINTRPLIQLGNVFMQLFIDKFTGKLSSVRLMDIPTLIKLHPFDTANKELRDTQKNEGIKQEILSKNNEMQVADLINMKRLHFGLKPLVWHDKLALVAYEQSKNMSENNDGVLPIEPYRELSERLEEAEVKFQQAEEIAGPYYLDAPAVVEDWFNSRAHREKLLDKQFTHMGVGVYENHITQNLLQIENEVH
ncbi:CAP domain-containing protein [Bacillus tuaregi]|uniref:CAP domain-containing protein n=1 Tax=Bacillus tuaregi TaxID=1816695 RepID=UPI0009FE41E0|nr:CAP-associated domain-containing protein [Bacillus tuaregi]